jgi:hypothetical protein
MPMAGPDRPEIFSLWVQGALGRLEQACLASFLRHGHRVSLYAYGEVTGIPAGVVRRDARDVMSDNILPAVGEGGGRSRTIADMFRYRGLQKGRGIWVDTDVLCIRPFPDPGDILVGYEDETVINNAVLYLRADHPVLLDAVEWSHPDRVPYWLSRSKRFKLWARKLAGRPKPPAQFPAGAHGPKLLTALMGGRGLKHQALPPEALYPLPWPKAEAAFDGSLRLADVAGERTLAFHFWNDRIKHLKNRAPVAGSIFAEALAQHRDDEDLRP